VLAFRYLELDCNRCEVFYLMDRVLLLLRHFD